MSAPADGEEARHHASCRPSARPTCRLGLGPARGGGTYHALFPRAWQTFEPEPSSASRLVGEQLSPVIAGDLESSALPVGVFDWWVENPGPDPLTVGLLLTWEDPPRARASRSRRARARSQLNARRGVSSSDPAADAPTGLRGTFAIAARADDGLAISTRGPVRFRSADTTCGPTSRQMAGSTPADRRPTTATAVPGRRRSPSTADAGAR